MVCSETQNDSFVIANKSKNSQASRDIENSSVDLHVASESELSKAKEEESAFLVKQNNEITSDNKCEVSIPREAARRAK